MSDYPCVLPTFFNGDDTECVEEWLSVYEAIAESSEWDDEYKRLKVPAYLRGAALRWYRAIKSEAKTWKLFEEKFLAEYRPADWKWKKKSEFYSLKQVNKESISEFISRFRRICGDLPDIPEEIKKERFIDGLLPEYRKWVILTGPETICEAFSFAKRAEAAVCAEKNPKSQATVTHQPVAKERSVQRVPEGFDMDSLADELSRMVIKRIESDHKPVSNYRANIMCYNCQKNGHRAWFCPEHNEQRDGPLKGKGLAFGESQPPVKPSRN